MSEEVNNTNPTPNESTGEKPLSQDISLAEAREITKEAEATGKSVQEIIEARKNGGKAPVQSNQSAIKDAAAEAKRKLKIGNDEVDEDEVIKIYQARKQHQAAASRELNEGKQARKQAEEFLSMMKDPQKLFDVIQKLGHDPRQLSEKYLVSHLEDEMMDPRDKELRDAKAKLRHIEDMERKQLEAVEKQRLDELKSKYAKEYETQFVESLKESGLPATKAMVGEMAKYIQKSAKIGYKMSPSEAAQLVKEDVTKAQLALYGDANGDMLLKLLGDDAAQKILAARGQKPRNPEQNLRTPSEQGPPSDRSHKQGNKRMTAKEWREFNRKR